VLPYATPAERRAAAIERTKAAVAALAAVGVEARVVGSLASGEFMPTSDVDLLVTRCPRDLKYSIEGTVEDILGDIAFDVLYLEEVRPERRDELLRHSADARRIS